MEGGGRKKKAGMRGVVFPLIRPAKSGISLRIHIIIIIMTGFTVSKACWLACDCVLLRWAGRGQSISQLAPPSVVVA